MLIKLPLHDQIFTINLSKPLDISIPLEEGANTVNAFYAPLLSISPVVAGNFIGDTQQGGVVNFKNLQINPHGNGTHTECVGHISPRSEKLNQHLHHFFFSTKLISVYPQKLANGDRVILKEQLSELLSDYNKEEALIIRTLPNDNLKLVTNYSGANPPYIHYQAMEYIVGLGIQHFLIDVPSVDREEDGGQLLAHKAFWQYPENIRFGSTITELAYVPNTIKDGVYLLNLMVLNLGLDVSPSRPVLYQLQ